VAQEVVELNVLANSLTSLELVASLVWHRLLTMVEESLRKEGRGEWGMCDGEMVGSEKSRLDIGQPKSGANSRAARAESWGTTHSYENGEEVDWVRTSRGD
jgi:hypothetical protein